MSNYGAIPETEHLMTPGEVAALFRGRPKNGDSLGQVGQVSQH